MCARTFTALKLNVHSVYFVFVLPVHVIWAQILFRHSQILWTWIFTSLQKTKCRVWSSLFHKHKIRSGRRINDTRVDAKSASPEGSMSVQTGLREAESVERTLCSESLWFNTQAFGEAKLRGQRVTQMIKQLKVIRPEPLSGPAEL